MKIQIWTSRTGTGDALELWCGEVAAIPRVGERLSFWDGWCSEAVRSVDHDLCSGVIEVVLVTADPSGEYAEELAKRS